MLSRFALPAVLLAVFGVGLGGGAAYSWQTIQAQRNEILQLQEFCQSVELGPNFAQVKRVIDGDTFELVDGERVRLIGLDAPEICHFKSNGELQDPDCVDEPGGQAATEFLRELLEGQEVVLVGDEVVGDRDYFGRLLRYVYLEDRFINLELIQKGYATIYKDIEKGSKFYDEFKMAEVEAQEFGLGVWFAN